MGKHLLKLGIGGKLDITVKCYDINDNIIKQSSLTYDSKPLIKELIAENTIEGVVKMEIFSTPSCKRKVFLIK